MNEQLRAPPSHKRQMLYFLALLALGVLGLKLVQLSWPQLFSVLHLQTCARDGGASRFAMTMILSFLWISYAGMSAMLVFAQPSRMWHQNPAQSV